VVVPAGTGAAFLAPLEIGRLPGIGVKTEAALKAKGVRRICDLFIRTESELHALFGDGWRGVMAAARGEDESPVETVEEDAKSYSQQETFREDIGDPAEIECIAKRMVDELMPKIRADGKRVRTLTLKVRYPGMENETAGRSLGAASDLEAPFYPLVGPLLRQAWTRRRPLRLISVRFSGVEDGPAQLEMFAEADEKRRRLASVLDRLNERGRTTVVRHGHQLGRQPDS
jgi:DNA polymerase-4